MEFKERAQQAVLDSIKIAEERKRRLEHLRARLEFRSADSEAGSFKGPMGIGAAGEAGHHFPERAPEREKRMEEDGALATNGLAALLRGWGQLKANDGRWPTFDGRYASYPRFKREWVASGRHITLW
jgi:hypothetical protein